MAVSVSDVLDVAVVLRIIGLTLGAGPDGTRLIPGALTDVRSERRRRLVQPFLVLTPSAPREPPCSYGRSSFCPRPSEVEEKIST